MAIEIREEWVRRFIGDPVMAAAVILGAEMDTFQRAKFRYMWFCPQVIDGSGWSVGKSELVWLLANLRAVLLPNPAPLPGRIVTVYYQTLDVANEVFWEKYQKYIARSELFKRQLKPGRGGKFGKRTDGHLEMPFRNGSKVQCPAGDFVNDSKNQASRRYNDLIIDEATVIDQMGRGVNKQLLRGATAPCFNQNHPVWANHVLMLGHAEDPTTHPFYERVRQYRRRIHDGSTRHVLLTSCYRDWSPAFAKRYRPDETIRDAMALLSDAEFKQGWLGVWVYGSKDWYSGADRQACCVLLVPQDRRRSPRVVYTLGWDTAPGMTRKADHNSGVVWAIEQASLPANGSLAGLMRSEQGFFRLYPVQAVVCRDLDVDQLAGLIHSLHLSFGFSMVLMDPGGGGAWVYKKLREGRQFIANQWHEVQGLCTINDSGAYPAAAPIVGLFKRGEIKIDHLWDERSRAGDEGIIEQSHTEFGRAWETMSLQWPLALEERSAGEQAALSERQRHDLQVLDLVYRQIGAVKLVCDNNDQVKLTARGFKRFTATGKKDAAYAALYGFMAALALIRGPESLWEDSGGESGFFVNVG